ncbi:hypothetical protein, partial [Vulcanococcus sp. Clear-D1]|uniref:hypothetical protein n=1 Tax=Vulcanococcus sp. Clear-D1 TaxID=2766970 RepID=UPI0019A90F63
MSRESLRFSRASLGTDSNFITLLEELTSSKTFSASQRINRHDHETESNTGERLSFYRVIAHEYLSLWTKDLATVYFAEAFKSASNTQQEQSSNISLETTNSLTSATGLSFTSQNPTDTQYTGNEVPGTLSYTIAGTTTTVQGIVSRQAKTGSQTDAFYFFDNGNFITNPSTEQGYAYLLVASRSQQTFSAGQTVGTSSDPVYDDLNDYLAFIAGDSTAPTVTASQSFNYAEN